MYVNFHISWTTFQFLVDLLQDDLVPQDTLKWKAIEVKKEVALFLYLQISLVFVEDLFLLAFMKLPTPS